MEAGAAGGMVYTGTSNIVLPVAGKAQFPSEYRDKSRLQFYASLLNTVEVNSTFYKLPRPATIARWAAEVPADFRFSFKLPKTITHARELMYDRGDIGQFLTVVQEAGKKKGCLLVQFPPSVKVVKLPALRNILREITTHPLAAGWNIAVEFRDKSWYRPDVFRMLEDNSAVPVVQDMPASRLEELPYGSPFVYLRFHGPNGDYRGNYEDRLLLQHAAEIKAMQQEGKEVFAYFNNTAGRAVFNALDLADAVQGNSW
jgi:uncharacterized protein YecE (DUF72 family)